MPFSTTAVISSNTKFSQYPVEIIKLMNEMIDYFNSSKTSFASQAANILTGGGTMTVSSTWYVLWSQRFIAIGNGRSATDAVAGYFDISCPTSGTITGVGGATNKTATAAGIPLDSSDTLYYIPPYGATFTSVPTNFRVVGYSVDYAVPDTWIKIAFRNSEGGYVDFANGVSLRPNTSINTLLYDVLGTDVSGAVASANTLATARTINNVSFNGSANVLLYLMRYNNANLALLDQVAAQDMLGVGVDLAASSVYEINGAFDVSKIAGVTSMNLNFLFTAENSLTINSMKVQVFSRFGATLTAVETVDQMGLISALNTALALYVPSVTAAVATQVHFRGIVDVAVAGRLTPQISQSAVAGGVSTVGAGAYMKAEKIGVSGVITSGTWG